MIRNKTYIAGDWTGDSNLIQEIYRWNNGNRWGLSFDDAHELTQARDDSLPCSIKKSLAARLDASKTFVLVVGQGTKNLTKGSCQFCKSYNAYSRYCARGHYVDYRSFVDYECEKAARDILHIVVLYNAQAVNRLLCPAPVRLKGQHIPAIYRGTNGNLYWDYHAIRRAIMAQ